MFFYAIIYGEIVRYNFLEVLFSCACMFMNVISVIQTEFPSQAKAANTVVLKIKWITCQRHKLAAKVDIFFTYLKNCTYSIYIKYLKYLLFCFL